MKLSKDEFIEKLKAYTGDRTDDETLAILEDAADSFEVDADDWRAKYDDLAKKYKDRFTEKIEEVKEEPDNEEPDEKKEIKIDDLFKEDE